MKMCMLYLQWLYVLIMSCTRFRVNLHYIVAWMSRNALLETGAVSNWVFVYELRGCGLKSRLWGLFLTIFLAQSRINFCLVFVFHKGMSHGIRDFILNFKNESLNISWTSQYSSILVLKSDIHITVFHSVSSWT